MLHHLLAVLVLIVLLLMPTMALAQEAEVEDTYQQQIAEYNRRVAEHEQAETLRLAIGGAFLLCLIGYIIYTAAAANKRAHQWQREVESFRQDNERIIRLLESINDRVGPRA